MKKGFTLSELIIALGVIGVIAAITFPLVTNLVPDKDKAKVLKINKTLSEITEILLSDPGLYYQPSNSQCEGLGCTDTPIDPEYIRYSGDNKYGMLLANRLHLMETSTATDKKNDPNTGKVTPASVSFMTVDGIKWNIETTYTIQNNIKTGNATVTLDFNTNSNNKCSYSSSCLKPNLFILNVDTNGKVTGGDALTRAYLANPYKLNDRKNDLKTAKADKT